MNSQPVSALVGKSVVVAEDEPLIAMLAEEIVLDLGCDLGASAATCAEALAALQQAKPDLLLLDVHLGSDSSEPVLAEAERLGVPVILSTGADPAQLDEAFAGRRVVKKPWTVADLEAAIRAVLDGPSAG